MAMVVLWYSTACATCCSESRLHLTGILFSFFPFGYHFRARKHGMREQSSHARPERIDGDQPTKMGERKVSERTPFLVFQVPRRREYAKRTQFDGYAASDTEGPSSVSSRVCSSRWSSTQRPRLPQLEP